MFIGSNHNINLIDLNDVPEIIINGKPIEYVNRFKYLGVIMDSKLTWKDQVIKTCSTASKILYRLRATVNNLNTIIKR